MKFDMPYLKFQALVRKGLGAVPSLRSCAPYSVEIGVIADETGITWYSRNDGAVLLAQCNIKAEGDVVVKESGGVAILTGVLDLGYRTNGHTVPFRKSAVERSLSPPDLIAGFDKSEWRVRCFSASDNSNSCTRAPLELHWELYRPSAIGRGPLLSCRFECAPLTDAVIPGTAELLLSINKDAMQRCILNLGNPSNRADAMFSVNMAEGSCYISLQSDNYTTMVELPPGGFNATCDKFQLGLDYSHLLSIVGNDPDADVHISKLSGEPNEDAWVRFRVSDHASDIACFWAEEHNLDPHIFDVPRQTRPILVDRMELKQSSSLLRAWDADKVRMRLHHSKGLITLLHGTCLRKTVTEGGVAALACQLPPTQQGISTWCVSTGSLMNAIRAIKGNRVRIRPRDDSLILDDPDRPFAKHRLAFLQPDDLPPDIEEALLDSEAGLLS